MKNLLLLLTMLFLISCTENEDLFNKQNRVSTSEYFDKRLISRSTSNISKNDAENIANIFFSPSITKAQPSNISIKEVICIKDKEDEPAFYILNYFGYFVCLFYYQVRILLLNNTKLLISHQEYIDKSFFYLY